MHVLNFSLHEFQRMSWVSQSMQQQWEDELNGMAEQLGKLLPELFLDVYSVQLLKVYPHELDDLQKSYAVKGLSVLVIEMDDEQLSNFFLQFDNDDRKVAILVGQLENIQHTQQTIINNDLSGFHRSLGTPTCCSNFISDLRKRNIQESIWPMAQTDSTEVRIQGHFATNTLLNRIGLTLLNHRPCQPDCSSSIEIALQVRSRAIQSGYQSLMSRLQEILSWDYSWSTLHGIAELKMPLFKLIYNSQPCAVKYKVDWQGTGQPETGLQGLGFPYKEPEKLFFSDSLAFKRGLDNNT